MRFPQRILKKSKRLGVVFCCLPAPKTSMKSIVLLKSTCFLRTNLTSLLPFYPPPSWYLMLSLNVMEVASYTPQWVTMTNQHCIPHIPLYPSPHLHSFMLKNIVGVSWWYNSMAYNSAQNEAVLKFLVNSPFTLFSAMFHPVTSSPMILHD
jgi:hypothetical protein